MSDKRLRYLFHSFFNKTATAEERAELFSLLGRTENDDETHALLKEAWEKLDADEHVFTGAESEAMLHRLLRSAQPGPALVEAGLRRPVIRMRRLMAAAVVLLILSTVAWFRRFSHH